MLKDKRGLAPIVIILITAVVSLAVAGGGVWYWQDQQAKKQKEDSNKRIAELQKQVDDSKKEVEELKNPSNSTASTLNDSSTQTKTFNWTNAGFSFKYPSDWKGQGNRGLATSDFTGTADHLQFFSNPLPGGNSKDYMCVELTLDSKDAYELSGGNIAVPNLGNNFSLYQKKMIETKSYVWSWLTHGEPYSIVDLPNGKKILSTIIYSCTEGDVDQSTLSYEQQIQSKEYKQAIDIFKSIKFN